MATCTNCGRDLDKCRAAAQMAYWRNADWINVADCERAAHARTRAELAAASATLARVRAAVIVCAYCNGVGAQVCLPGDVVEPCPACGGLRAALDPEGTAAQLAALGAK